MAAAAYRHTVRDLKLSDLLGASEFVRETMATPGWKIVTEAIEAHQQKMLARLLNESVPAEEIPRLRGLLSGLESMTEAAESILALAVEREAEARREAQQEIANA